MGRYKIRPHRSVGAGSASASEALAFELVTFAKTSSSHIALLGGFAAVAQEVKLGYGLQPAGPGL